MQKHIYILTSVLTMALLAPSASARPHSPYGAFFANQPTVSQNDVVRFVQKTISPSEAKSIARKKVRDAKVIDLSSKKGAYKVRMQKKNGHVVDVYIDASTGRVQ